MARKCYVAIRDGGISDCTEVNIIFGLLFEMTCCFIGETNIKYIDKLRNQKMFSIINGKVIYFVERDEST